MPAFGHAIDNIESVSQICATHFACIVWRLLGQPWGGSAAVSWPKSARDETYTSGRTTYFGVSLVMSSLWFLPQRSALYLCRCRCTLQSCTARISFQKINWLHYRCLPGFNLMLYLRFVLWLFSCPANRSVAVRGFMFQNPPSSKRA